MPSSIDLPPNINPRDFQRLELKIDRMADALEKLVLVEERQSNQATSLTEQRSMIEANKLAIEKAVDTARNAVDSVEKKVDQWINRGIGIWALAGVVFILIQVALRITGKG